MSNRHPLPSLILIMVVDRMNNMIPPTSAQTNSGDTLNMTPPTSPSTSKGISDQYLITLDSNTIDDTQRERILKIISDRITNEGIEIVDEYHDIGVLVIKTSSKALGSVANNSVKELQRDLRIKISIEQDREEKIS
jgi:urease alpha subunit